MTKPSQEELDAMLAYWQRVLRVQDWDVKVAIFRQEHMPEGVLGQVIPTPTKKRALIKILDPIDYGTDSMWEQDIEQYIVHELIHLHFEPFMKSEDDHAHVAQEQAIDLLSRGMVELKRNAK